MVTNRMIIERLRKVEADLQMGDKEYADTYHVALDCVRDAQKYRAVALVQVIADELEEEEREYQRGEKTDDGAQVFI